MYHRTDDSQQSGKDGKFFTVDFLESVNYGDYYRISQNKALSEALGTIS